MVRHEVVKGYAKKIKKGGNEMNLNLKTLSTLLVIFFLLVTQSINADNNYELVDSSDLSFDITFENNLYNGVVTKFYNPVTKSSGVYVKIKNTTITSFTCNGQKLEVKNNKIDDGFVETTKYGNMKIGLYGPPPHEVIVWLTPEQKTTLQELISSKQKQEIPPHSGKALVGNEAEKKYEPDQALVKASFKKAKELGHNPIPVFVKKKGGNIIITGGVMMSIRNGRQTWVENDMLINVGEFSIPVGDFKVSKGEYAIVKGNKFVKQAGKIIPD